MKILILVMLGWIVLSVPVGLFLAAFIRAGNRKEVIDNR